MDPTLVSSDLLKFDAMVTRAREHAAAQECGRAVEEYVRALQVVRAPLMGDAGVQLATPALLVEAARGRVVIAQEALEAAWRCGRLGQVIGLVEQIAQPMVFEENLQAQLIRALGRCGRRRDAMALFERVRHGLLEELGVDPGEELRAAHEELLAIGSPTRAARHGGTGGFDERHGGTEGSRDGSGRQHRPAELPARVRGFTPRPEAQRVLDDIAERGEAGAVLITAIGGMGGIGKTALAVAWAHDLAERFPDGQLYVNLRGFDAAGRVMSTEEALNHLLGAIGAEKSPAAESLEARSARFRSMMARRAMLVLLDNASDAEQVRPLLPGHEGCLVIVTSRNQLSGLVVHEGAVPVRLDRMDDAQARHLLTQRVGAERLGVDTSAIDAIVRSACGLPLALSIIAARLAVEPELSLASVASELLSQGNGGGLAEYSAGRDDLASVFAWSYDVLEVEEAHTFRGLAVHPGSEMSLESIASLSGLDLHSARQVTDRLVAASLLQRRSRWFVVHDLLRVYASGLLPDHERTQAELRLVAHYVQSTRNAWSVFGRAPVGDIDPIILTTPQQAEQFADRHRAASWYLHEREVLI